MSRTPAGQSVRFAIGITGHRASNPALAANATQVAATLAGIFAEIESAIAAERVATPLLEP